MSMPSKPSNGLLVPNDLSWVLPKSRPLPLYLLTMISVMIIALKDDHKKNDNDVVNLTPSIFLKHNGHRIIVWTSQSTIKHHFSWCMVPKLRRILATIVMRESLFIYKNATVVWLLYILFLILNILWTKSLGP